MTSLFTLLTVLGVVHIKSIEVQEICPGAVFIGWQRHFGFIKVQELAKGGPDFDHATCHGEVKRFTGSGHGGNWSQGGASG